jgi:hypothetical protein
MTHKDHVDTRPTLIHVNPGACIKGIIPFAGLISRENPAIVIN